MDFFTPPVVAAAVAGVVALLTSIVTAFVAFKVASSKAALDFKTEFAAERIARELMMDPDWRWRSFEMIKHHLGGFENDELRKILVRARAMRIKSRSGKEMWGLLDRNRDCIGFERLDTDPEEKEVD